MTRQDQTIRAVMPGLLAALAAVAAMVLLAGAGGVPAAASLVAVYAFGYVAGALLVDERADPAGLSWAVIRLVVGLLLTTVAFFLSLLMSLPWFLGPAAVCAGALVFKGWGALRPPQASLTFSVGGVMTGLLGAVALSPIVISALRMAPGEYPPVFFNVDTAYFVEKVHALVRTDTFPPESLGVLDGRRAYHFGVHGMAALISRSSGLAPHHSLFLLILPVLSAGILAAAVAAARVISPALPGAIAVPMLLVAVPTLWYAFWGQVWERLVQWVTSGSLSPLDSLTQDYELWGVASNNGQNVVAHFLVLAIIASVAAAPSRGWRLPVFLVASSVLFKTPTAIALVTGFGFAQFVRAATTRRLQPLLPALAASAAFVVVYVAFWVVPGLPAEFKTEWYPLLHLKSLESRGGLAGFLLDAAWLLLPALMVFLAAPGDRDRRSLPLLCFALAPYLVVNLLRSVDIRPGVSGTDDDWLQIIMPVPLLLHAFVLSTAGQRWGHLGRLVRVAFVCVVAVTVLPPIAVAARYSMVLLLTPERGHEFVDNRPLAEALATISTQGTILVTNDLRYPAEGFRRDNRQMQIPALFGHQAFAVNHAYEVYAFSAERRQLQGLLQTREWSEAIDQAARRFRWTHLLIRKDYVHPDRLPLDRTFENEVYAVYRFPQ